MRTIPIIFFSLFFLCLFHVTFLLAYDPIDPSTFRTDYYSLPSDTSGYSYAMAYIPMTVQRYTDMLNAVSIVSDNHNLYTGMMTTLPSTYTTNNPFAPIQRTPSSFSVLGTTPNIPMTFMTLPRAVRWINWHNNGETQDPTSTEHGTYIISENPTNITPPGGFTGSYQTITLDSNSISQAIIKDHSARQSDPSKPPLTMVLLPTKNVLVSFHQVTNYKWVPTDSNNLDFSFSYFWEWTSSMYFPNAIRNAAYYGAYDVVQGYNYSQGLPTGDNKLFFTKGFRLMQVTFPTSSPSNIMPTEPPLPLPPQQTQ